MLMYFNWPMIIITTIVLYALTIITLPFDTVTATILLFSLIGFWSRLPGLCIREPVRILYMMDFIDIFAIIIALYVGPVQGAIFALIWNIYPWICGAQHVPMLGCVKDGVTQAILCIFVPVFGAMTGGNLLAVVLIFSIIRFPLFMLISLFLPTRGLIEQIFHVIVGATAALFINSFYATIFGNFFTHLLQKGASFSWPLFFIATIIIFLFGSIAFGVSPKSVGKGMGKRAMTVFKKKEVKRVFHDDKDEVRRIKESI